MIGCPFNSERESWHKAYAIPKTTARIDLDYLKALIDSSIEPTPEYCTFLSHTTGRAKRCGMYRVCIGVAYAEHTLTLCRN
jgi:hypothetical protein